MTSKKREVKIQIDIAVIYRGLGKGSLNFTDLHKNREQKKTQVLFFMSYKIIDLESKDATYPRRQTSFQRRYDDVLTLKRRRVSKGIRHLSYFTICTNYPKTYFTQHLLRF